jgi:hypothetical protein
VSWAERPIAPAAERSKPGPVLAALLLVGSLVPLVAMLVALFAAAWLREGRHKNAAARRSS